MYMDGDLVGTFKLPELKKHIDENAPVDKIQEFCRAHEVYQRCPIWFVEKTAIQRLLRFMKRERVLVAVWCGRDASSRKKAPNRKVAIVLAALREDGDERYKTEVAREALYGKTTGLTETEEGQVQSVLTLARRFLNR